MQWHQQDCCSKRMHSGTNGPAEQSVAVQYSRVKEGAQNKTSQNIRKFGSKDASR